MRCRVKRKVNTGSSYQVDFTCSGYSSIFPAQVGSVPFSPPLTLLSLPLSLSHCQDAAAATGQPTAVDDDSSDDGSDYDSSDPDDDEDDVPPQRKQLEWDNSHLTI